MLERPDKDNYYLDIADTVCKRSTCLRRKYGAVIVNNDVIVATGYNGAPRGLENCKTCIREELGLASGERYELCRALHAEDNAITAAGREKCTGATLYLAGFTVADEKRALPVPCLMCARKILNAGITRVVGRFKHDAVCEIDIKDVIASAEKKMINSFSR